MPAPKTTVRVLSKNGNVEVKYESSVDSTQYYIYELTRAALRDVSRFVKKVFKTSYYSHFQKHTNESAKAVAHKVYAGKYEDQPHLEIGLKKGPVPGYYAYFQEFGTSKKNAYGIIVPKLGLLTNAVKDNVAEIVKIESQYLTALSGEAARLEALVDEEDEGDDDE